jgi:hypothetical protein
MRVHFATAARTLQRSFEFCAIEWSRKRQGISVAAEILDGARESQLFDEISHAFGAMQNAETVQCSDDEYGSADRAQRVGWLVQYANTIAVRVGKIIRTAVIANKVIALAHQAHWRTAILAVHCLFTNRSIRVNASSMFAMLAA